MSLISLTLREASCHVLNVEMDEDYPMRTNQLFIQSLLWHGSWSLLLEFGKNSKEAEEWEIRIEEKEGRPLLETVDIEELKTK